MTAKGPPESAPSTIPSRGDMFGASVRAKFVPSLAEDQLLIEVSRLLDLSDNLAVAIRRDGTMVVGSTGQLRCHPGISELRACELAIGRLMAQLDIRSEDGESLSGPDTVKARQAVNTRWARPQTGSVVSENATRAAMIRWHGREAGSA